MTKVETDLSEAMTFIEAALQYLDRRGEAEGLGIDVDAAAVALLDRAVNFLTEAGVVAA